MGLRIGRLGPGPVVPLAIMQYLQKNTGQMHMHMDPKPQTPVARATTFPEQSTRKTKPQPTGPNEGHLQPNPRTNRHPEVQPVGPTGLHQHNALVPNLCKNAERMQRGLRPDNGNH